MVLGVVAVAKWTRRVGNGGEQEKIGLESSREAQSGMTLTAMGDVKGF